MKIWGIGPLLALAGGISFFLVFALRHVLGFEVSFSASFRPVLFMAGMIFGLIGGYFWLSSIFLVRQGFKSHQLVTGGG